MNNSYRTLDSMRDEVAQFIQDNSQSRQAKITASLNQSYALVATENIWVELLRAQEQTITATGGKRFLYLPKDCGPLFLLFDGDIELTVPGQGIVELFRRMGNTHDVQGIIQQYAQAGQVGRKADFHTAAETITFSSGAGNSGKVVRVRGLDSTGDNEISESVTLDASGDGVTSASFTDIWAISSDSTQTVTIVVTGTTSAIEYATLASGEYTAKYKRLRLNFIPSTDTTMTLYYQRMPQRLINDDDVVDIPVSDVIVEMSKAQQFGRDKRPEMYDRHMMQAQNYLAKVLAGSEQHDMVHQAIPIMGLRRAFDDKFVVVSTS